MLIGGRSARHRQMPSMMRSALSRSWCAKLARYSATQTSALLRRDSNEVSMLSSNSRSEDGFLMASASMADELRSKRLSVSETASGPLKPPRLIFRVRVSFAGLP